MENASKALLIAGGVLFGMLILVTAIYLFVTYNELGISYEQIMEATEIAKFNSNFTKFERKRRYNSTRDSNTWKLC